MSNHSGAAEARPGGGTPAPSAPDGGTGHHHPTEDEVDEALDESLPASDPPAFTHTHPGPPDHRE